MQTKVETADRALLEILEHGVLASLHAEARTLLLDSAYTAGYPRGCVVGDWMRPGVFIVISGHLRAYVAAPDGTRITFRYIGAGDFVGTAVALGQPVPGGVETLSQTTLLHLDLMWIGLLARREASLAWALVEDSSRRMGEALRTLSALTSLNVRTRVAHDLLQRSLAAGRCSEGAAVDVTIGELAEGVGSSKRAVAAALQCLHDAGVIKSGGVGLVIIDPERLAAEAVGIKKGGVG